MGSVIDLQRILGKKLEIPVIITILLMMAEEGPIGRYAISKHLGISEGTIRGLLRRLAEFHIIKPIRAGSVLTEKGIELLIGILKSLGIVSIKKLSLANLSGSRTNVVAQVRGFRGTLGLCLEERDIAVRYGARGAIIMRYNSGIIEVPGVYPDLREHYPKEDSTIREMFDLKDNDLIVVVFDHDEWALRRPLIAIVLKLKGYLSI